MKFLLIAGHGNGDSGAVGCGYEEADLTREALRYLRADMKEYSCKVTTYPTTHNCYDDLRAGNPYYSFSDFDCIIELHFNAATASAHGTETLYRTSINLANKVDKAIAKIGFTDRGAKLRTDLQNMNVAYSLGVPYILIETCFITNSADMKLYKANIAKVWKNVAKAVASFYGLKTLKSKITLSNANYPKKLKKGERFIIKGTVKSNRELKSVVVVVEDAQTNIDNKDCTKKVYPADDVYNLVNIDPYISFRKLPVGKYRYKVKATDITGYQKTLLKKVFVVTK